jgi:hypothetical protein
MAYGTLAADYIIYTFNNSGTTATISSVVNGNFASVSSTGTISGVLITGNTGSYGTITGVSGIFTAVLSGASITGASAGFTVVTGTTITGTTGNFATITGTTGNFTTITGTTGNFAIVSGATVTGAVVNDNIGNVRNIPQNSQTTSYTLVSGDAGKHVFTTSGVTVPSGVFVIGQAVTIYNNTTGNLTITQGTNVTLRQAGASGTGNRTLAQRGLATVLCVSGSSGTEFVIAGNIT